MVGATAERLRDAEVMRLPTKRRSWLLPAILLATPVVLLAVAAPFAWPWVQAHFSASEFLSPPVITNTPIPPLVVPTGTTDVPPVHEDPRVPEIPVDPAVALSAGEDAGTDAFIPLDAYAALDAYAPPDAYAAPDAFLESEAVAVEDPNAPPSDAETLVRQANEARDPSVKETLFRRALSLDPRNHYAMLGLADVFMDRGQPGEAIPLLEGAIRRRGRRASYRVLLGDARRDAGDMAGARSAWQDALEIDPDDRTARTRLGQ